MFKCDFCEQFSQPGEGIKSVVVRWRQKTYLDGGKGYEAALVRKSCPRCDKQNAEPPAVVKRPNAIMGA